MRIHCTLTLISNYLFRHHPSPETYRREASDNCFSVINVVDGVERHAQGDCKASGLKPRTPTRIKHKPI